MSWRYIPTFWVVILFGIGGWFLAEAARQKDFVGGDIIGWAVVGGAVGFLFFFALKALLQKKLSLRLDAADYQDLRLLGFYAVAVALAFGVGYGLTGEVFGGLFASLIATGATYIVATLCTPAAKVGAAQTETPDIAPKPLDAGSPKA